MSWITLHMRVTTPLFNGGADPHGYDGLRADHEPGIHPASIRGAMRFWLRAFAGIVAGPDLDLLARVERRVLGGLSASCGAAASPVRLRIPDPPEACTDDPRPAFVTSGGTGLHYLLGLGLSERDDSGPKNAKLRLTRAFVAPGARFQLRLRFTDDNAGVLALAALWMMCAYGGVGSRVRRGFGGLRIHSAEGDLPGPWNARTICTPWLDDYDQLDRRPDPLPDRCLYPATEALRQSMASLRAIVVEEGGRFGFGTWQTPPSYPVLHKKFTRATLSGPRGATWEKVVGQAGAQLRECRTVPAGRTGRNRHTAEWGRIVKPEADGEQRGDDTRFRLGAYGLPVVFHDKDADDTWTVNADSGSGAQAEILRRASPIWLRPVAGGRGQWGLLSFAFLGQFLPETDASGVHLWHAGQQVPDLDLDVTNQDVESVVDTWFDAMNAY